MIGKNKLTFIPGDIDLCRTHIRMDAAPEKSAGMLFAYPLLFDVQIMLSNVVHVCFGISFVHERNGRGIFSISEINVQNLTTSNHIGDIEVSCSLSKIR